MRHSIIFLSICFVLIFSAISGITGEKPTEATNMLRTDGKINNWLVLGPFPNEKTDQPLPPEHVTRQGFQIDFLEILGGEKKAQLTSKTTVKYDLQKVGSGKVKSQIVSPNNKDIIDFQSMFSEKPFSIAYAFCTLYSKTDQQVHFFFGHDDGAKMWLNGELIHRLWPERGHGLIKRQYYLANRLKAGHNRILIKVENWGYDWNFHLEAFDSASVQPILKDMEERKTLEAFQKCHPRPEGEWDYMIAPGAFPKIVWNDPAAVQEYGGEISLNVQWYNPKQEPASQPGEPGRYIAYVTGLTKNDKKIRRFVTVYCRNPKWLPWYENNKVYTTYYENSGFNREAFKKSQELVAPILAGILREKMAQEEIGAIINSYWQEIQPANPFLFYDTPDVIHSDIQVALKRKILDISSDTYPALQTPKLLDKSARVLHTGTASEADVKKNAAKKLGQMCREWYEHSKEPFNVLIARHGVIVLHEAFGPCDVNQKYSVASITKSVAGLTFARFVEQGIIGIDDPVGRFLPDFPTEGSKVMTMRQLFTHTTGLEGHGNWGGLNNAWLDNVIALSLDNLPVGEVFKYNGMGYDLAGKVMEFVAGKSFQRVTQEQLWLPLGIEGSSLYDLGFSAMLNAEDIAKMGQLLLNKGSYGNRQLFSPETYNKILPKDLSQYYPKVQNEWGIGLTYRRTEKENGKRKSYILSENLIGHGSGSQCIFVVDLEHDLVIAQARRTGGKGYDLYYRKLLETVEDVLKD